MEPIVVRPEKEQGAMWFIAWAISFVLSLALCWGLLRTVDKLIFDLCLVGWLILMSLILLWILAFYKSLEYVIDSDSIKMRKGVFWRKSVTVPYTKITNIDVTQGPLQRVFNIGTIHIQTAGASGPRGAEAELKLLGVRDLEGLKDTIMARIRGYTISGTSDWQILRHMLKELMAIREVLEKRQS